MTVLTQNMKSSKYTYKKKKLNQFNYWMILRCMNKNKMHNHSTSTTLQKYFRQNIKNSSFLCLLLLLDFHLAWFVFIIIILKIILPNDTQGQTLISNIVLLSSKLILTKSWFNNKKLKIKIFLKIIMKIIFIL